VEFSKRNFESQLQRAQKKDSNMIPLGFSSQNDEVLQLKQGLNALSESPHETWLIEHGELEFTQELGNGTSGKVFKGLFQGRKVAIKVFRTVDIHTITEFKKEFRVMNVVRSPYLINFYGACLEPRICMVVEFCSRGSLYDVLRSEALDFNWTLALQFSKELFLGMNCLHSWDPQILHRDVKSLNLLVTKDLHLKVCDFGLARFNTPENIQTMTKMCGTFQYMAPEMFYGQQFTEKSDIYSCAIILWEMVTRVITGKAEKPFSEFNIKIDFQIPFQVAEKNVRPTIPSNTPLAWKALIEKCWSKAPNNRPSAREALLELEAIENLNRALTSPIGT